MSIQIGPVPPDNNAAYNRMNVINTDTSLQKEVESVTSAGEREKKLNAVKDCRTCANRRYQDASSDPGVSMKTPTKLTPDQAATAVRTHEGEHYSREASKAKQEGREVVSNNIRIFTSICPECGKTYVSGGETRTLTKKKEDNKDETGDLYKSLDVKI